MRLVIIGGVAGGMSAATRARRLNEEAEIIVLERDGYVSFANCGLPYYIGGEITDRSKLILHTPETLAKRANLDVRLHHEVTSIDPENQQVTVNTPQGEEVISYDALVISTGAAAITPPITGTDHPSLSTLRTIPEMDRVMELADQAIKLASEQGRTPLATVLGGGFIGLETVEALVGRGFTVNLVDMAPQVLPPLDAELATYLAEELTNHQVGLYLGQAAEAIVDGNAGESVAQVRLADGTLLPADLVVMSIGVRPQSELAKAAGIALGERGGILVDEEQRTSHPQIWAVGDVTEVEFASGRRGPVMLAGPANRQGRRAADSIMGRPVPPAKPVLGTAVVRVFDQVAAVTGANQRELQSLGIEYFTVRIHTGNHAGYYPGAETVHLQAYFSMVGELLGAQGVGKDGIDKRIDVLATALQSGMTADDLAELELCYSPPIGSAKDPVNMLGFVAQNKLFGLTPQWEAKDLDEVRGLGVILDVRSVQEFQAEHLPDAIHIPLPELRERIDEVREAAQGRKVFVHCLSGLRSHLAVRTLRAEGVDASNLSGGACSLKATRPADLVKG